MSKYLFILLTIIIIMSSCKSKTHQEVVVQKANSITQNSVSEFGSKTEFLLSLKDLNSLSFNVISYSKKYDSSNQYFLEYEKLCKNWLLDTNKIKKIFLGISSIDGPEWDNYYDYAPCEYDGVIKVNKKLFNYIIEGGSIIHVIFPDTTLTFGYKKVDKTLFINTPAYEDMK